MKLFAALILAVLFFAGISSCKKGYDETADLNTNAILNVVNATGDTLNFYLNGTRQNISSSIYPTGNTGYLSNFIVGAQNYQFKKAGHAEVLFSQTITLKDSIAASAKQNVGVYNTLFLTGESADKSLLLEDTTTITSADSALVRFVHTADGAGNLSLAFGTVTGFANQTYKSVSNYKKFPFGLTTVTVLQNGQQITGASVILTLATSKYTFFVKGLPNGTGKNKFQLGYFTR
ncbi:DUF4397 domain-containing protein [Mucilaginibacter sp. KACC 22063]|uniref:DUF4397 domain-containing protein n=1 Tax=Mucilaginibacter sp. KACC 22063 TaxID=3025666 RepID=UPI00236557CA|nr:DUF4397 domain-containing protein [Mucilaginibacter sp. KACC 22063]WDF54544.1 hypothetical protein PQ461_16555 [Mucilaginibacter sp. KACC 22063]